jgi:hypothetical protein
MVRNQKKKKMKTCIHMLLWKVSKMSPRYESALLELDSILQKPCTRTSFDLVVAWLEAALHDNTFKDLSKLPRRKSVMKRLNAKFRTPPHKLKTVALETGREGGVDDFQ